MIVVFPVILYGDDKDITQELFSESYRDSGAPVWRLGYARLRRSAGLRGEERSRQIRGSQLFKMLVMLLFHFHELCCNPQDQPASSTESASTTKHTALHWHCKDFSDTDALLLFSLVSK